MTNHSAELYREASKYLPGGVSRNTLLRSPHPYYADKGFGCRTVDIDGAERIDFANNMASLIHGHAHPAIVEAVAAQLQRGTAFTMATKVEVDLARHLCQRSSAIEQIRFVNSGTEAVMAALKAARAHTLRPKIAKCEGTYHGAYDYAEVSQESKPQDWGPAESPVAVPLAQGTPSGVLDDVLVLPFNHPEEALAILDRHCDEVAGVLIDLMPHRAGLVPAQAPFVRALQDWTRRNGALLILDEVITFRTEHAGMQSRYDLRPDLVALGKIIGGGFPGGAVGGRREVMKVFERQADGTRLPHSGTFSANPITMTAGYTALSLYDEASVQRLNRLGQLARDKLNEAIVIADVPASVTGTGSMFRVHMKSEVPRDYRSTYCTDKEQKAVSAFVNELGVLGILLIYSGAGALSTPMTEAEIDALAEAAVPALRRAKEQLT